MTWCEVVDGGESIVRKECVGLIGFDPRANQEKQKECGVCAVLLETSEQESSISSS